MAKNDITDPASPRMEEPESVRPRARRRPASSRAPATKSGAHDPLDVMEDLTLSLLTGLRIFRDQLQKFRKEIRARKKSSGRSTRRRPMRRTTMKKRRAKR